MSVITVGKLQSRIDDFLIDHFTVTEDVASHTHDFIELAYLKEGSLLHICNGVSRNIGRGDFFIIDYTVPHTLQYTGTRSVVINCIFRPCFIDTSLKDCRSFNEVLNNYLIHFDDRCNFRPHSGEIFEDTESEVEAALGKIDHEYFGGGPASVQLIRIYLIEIIILTMRKMRFEFSQCDSDIDYIRDIVRKRFFEDLRLNDIAATLNISVSHISRKFSEFSGCSFKEYLQRMRIEEACRDRKSVV